jgi:hypothetical protein
MNRQLHDNQLCIRLCSLDDIPLKIAQNWSRVLQRIETWDEIEIQGNEVILQTLLNLYCDTVKSILFVMYQFPWISWVG